MCVQHAALPGMQAIPPHTAQTLKIPTGNIMSKTARGGAAVPDRNPRAGRNCQLNKTVPAFALGDTVIVNVNVVEGERKRVQAYEGVVIAKRNKGPQLSFIVRKISNGEGVERTFQTYSPLIASVELKRRGAVRRAKLYYLRDRSGKSARIREKLKSANLLQLTLARIGRADMLVAS